MTKLNNEQILEIQRLRKEGKTQMELAREFNVCLSTIQYHTDDKQKAKKIEHSRNYFKSLSKSRKKELYDKRKEYWRNYTKNRYHTDEEYRTRMLNYQKEYNQRKSGNDKPKSFR